jgi:hypothetical protein
VTIYIKGDSAVDLFQRQVRFRELQVQRALAISRGDDVGPPPRLPNYCSNVKVKRGYAMRRGRAPGVLAGF